MKILAVMGSPRKKGNTYHVVEKIKDQLLQEDKNIEFEYLFLPDCNLQLCTGCFACIAKGQEKCPLKDDRAMMEAKMLEADGIIFAAPCYAMGVPAIMKNFIDRFAFTLHRPIFFDKAFLAVSTVGGVMGLKQTLEQLALLSAGGKSVQKLGISMPPIPMKGFDKKAENNIQKASKAFYPFAGKAALLPNPPSPETTYYHQEKGIPGGPGPSRYSACPGLPSSGWGRGGGR
jgi:multimeric flavodoxin WrbA